MPEAKYIHIHPRKLTRVSDVFDHHVLSNKTPGTVVLEYDNGLSCICVNSKYRRDVHVAIIVKVAGMNVCRDLDVVRNNDSFPSNLSRKST